MEKREIILSSAHSSPHLRREAPRWRKHFWSSAEWWCAAGRPWQGRRPGSQGRGTHRPGSQPGRRSRRNASTGPDTRAPLLCPNIENKMMSKIFLFSEMKNWRYEPVLWIRNFSWIRNYCSESGSSKNVRADSLNKMGTIRILNYKNSKLDLE